MVNIFFSTVALDPEIGAVYPGMGISEIINNGNKPQSGSSNIYWISSEFIAELKKE